MTRTDLVEVRLLGDFRVVRADGEEVDARQWRTSKSADLFRMLAVEGGRPVAVARIAEVFWPDVEPGRARASIRTAVAHLRRAVGPGVVERVGDQLRLHHVWVDVVELRRLYARARVDARAGDSASVVRQAWAVEALYLGDLVVADVGSPWADEARRTLASGRADLLAEAAHAAVALSWLRDAADLAEAAIALGDGVSESACRSAMLAYAGMGQIDRAVRIFSDCRAVWSEELGTDPSPLTMSVFTQVLQGARHAIGSDVLVARRQEMVDAHAWWDAGAAAHGPQVLLLSGEPGSGRSRLAMELAALPRETSASTTVPVVLPSMDAPGPLLARVQEAVDLTAHSDGGTTDLVVPVLPSEVATIEGLFTASGRRVAVITLGRLERVEVHDLAHAVLGERVTGRLLDRLEEQGGGLAGRTADLLRGWVRAGAVICTPGGLDLLVDDPSSGRHLRHEQSLRDLQHQLTPNQARLMQAIALVARPVAAVELALHWGAHSEYPEDEAAAVVERLLDQLTDLGALSSRADGFELAHPRLREATINYMRPSARRRLRHDLHVSGVRLAG